MYAAMTLDATYHQVRSDGIVRDRATLIAHGIRRDDDKRMILGFSCTLSEAEVHCRGFLNRHKERGNADDRAHAEERFKDFVKTYDKSQPGLVVWAVLWRMSAILD